MTPAVGDPLLPVGPEWPDYALEELDNMVTIPPYGQKCPISRNDRAVWERTREETLEKFDAPDTCDSSDRAQHEPPYRVIGKTVKWCSPKDAHDVGIPWSELPELTQAMLTVAVLESAMVISSFMDISDLNVGEYCLSIESGGWSWMAARTWLWTLCGSDDWRVAAQQCEHWMSNWVGPNGNGLFMNYGLGASE
tara:strand:- start:193 stop:774 length:582 start_codon:yes stop_codon:yes gene_type:complete